jgi:hypothetical protein
MAHFAKINSSGIVEQVIVVDSSDAPTEAQGLAFIASIGLSGIWVQTSHNGNIRKNPAGIGYTYDSTRDAFIAPKPFESWALVEKTCQWEAPTPYPTDGKDYFWNESTLSWIEIAP